MKNILTIKDFTFEVVNAGEFLRLAMLPDMAQKYNNSDCGKSFVAVMDEYAQQVASLPLNYLKKPIFSFVVLPQGEVFQSLTTCPFPKGMCGLKSNIDDTYKTALAVDEIWFSQGFSRPQNIESQIGLIHELSHIIHSAYFQHMGCLGEGFAELLPHYLMSLHNPQHTKLIQNLDISSLPVLGTLNRHGMFSNPEDKKLHAQYRSSYLSAYLWMLAYIKRIEQQHNLNKFQATNFMLEHFAELKQLPWAERMAGAAELVALSETDCFTELTLQHHAIQYYNSDK